MCFWWYNKKNTVLINKFAKPGTTISISTFSLELLKCMCWNFSIKMYRAVMQHKVYFLHIVMWMKSMGIVGSLCLLVLQQQFLFLFIFLIFVVPSIMLYSSEISPTRFNNCVFILRNGFTLHVSGDNLTHHQEYICCIWPQVSRLT